VTSNPLVGHEPSSDGMGSLSTLPKDAPPELLAEFLAAKELERKKGEWASWANAEYTKCKNARIPFEQQWYLNLAFTAGKQYMAPINSPAYGFRLTTPKAPPWRVRLVINKIRTAVRTECSKLTTSKPIPTVIPATNEDEDFSAAAVGEQILKSEFATAEFESTYRKWVWWGVVCGTSFLKQYYDAAALDYDSREVPPPPTFPGTNSPIPDEILEKAGLLDKVKQPVPAQGKICIERVTPFHLYVPDLLNESLESQPYVIHVMTKSPLWVKHKYGIDAQCDARASNTILDAATIIAKGAEEHLDSVMVKEVWIKPKGHKDFPDGGLLTIVNERVVAHSEKWPYSFPEYPFYKYDGVPTGGFYSASNVEDLIPLQKEYNKKRSQMIEIQNMMGKPKLIYQKGSLNPKMISSEPGQSVPYTPGYEKPEVMQGVEVPASFVTELQQLAQEFDDISGQHEISRGETSLSSLTSGTAIAYLQEQDDAKLNYQVSSIENACELLGKHYLHMASSYWSDSRLVRITGKNSSFEALHWKRGMLKGNTDVKIQTGSALPFSKAAKTALLTEMMQNGFVAPQDGLEVLNLGGLDKVIDDSLVDKRQAVRENLKMADLPEKMLKLLLEPAPGPNGEPPQQFPGPDGKPIWFNGDGTPFQPQPPVPVNSWDDDEQHIHWHNHFRKTQEFELLSPLKKKAFELHVQLHQMALMADLANQQGQVIRPGMGQPQQPVGALPPGSERQDPSANGEQQPGGGEQ
jgi:hypothetical protein